MLKRLIFEGSVADRDHRGHCDYAYLRSQPSYRCGGTLGHLFWHFTGRAGAFTTPAW